MARSSTLYERVFFKGGHMKGLTAIYQGKVVQKAHFRAYVYSPDGSQHLVESWDEFEKKMESGIWFATKQQAHDAFAVEPIAEEKTKKPYKARVTTLELKEAVIPVGIKEPVGMFQNQMTDKVKQDDFLPTTKA